MSSVDVAPLVSLLIQTATVVVTALVPILVAYLTALTRRWLKNMSAAEQAKISAAIDQLLTKAVQYGSLELENVNAHHLTQVHVKDPRVAKAASYAIAQAPALLAKMGYDVSTYEGQKAVARMVTARLAPDLTLPPAPSGASQEGQKA